jgi:hypothetical protein
MLCSTPWLIVAWVGLADFWMLAGLPERGRMRLALPIPVAVDLHYRDGFVAIGHNYQGLGAKPENKMLQVSA